jgi:hypothetical protein
MKKKADIILIAGLIAVAAIIFLVVKLTQKPGSWAVVSVEGQEIQRIRLSEDGIHELNDGTNVLEIKDGRAHMIKADCPDKLCTYQGYIDSDGQAIICLPNRLTVVVSGPDSKTDFVL